MKEKIKIKRKIKKILPSTLEDIIAYNYLNMKIEIIKERIEKIEKIENKFLEIINEVISVLKSKEERI